MGQEAQLSPRPPEQMTGQKVAQRLPDRHPLTHNAPPPDYRLLSMAFLTMEMAEHAVAERDWDASQMLVELAMSVFYTATSLTPDATSTIEATRQRLDELSHVVHSATCGSACADDPDAIWSGNVV